MEQNEIKMWMIHEHNTNTGKDKVLDRVPIYADTKDEACEFFASWAWRWLNERDYGEALNLLAQIDAGALGDSFSFDGTRYELVEEVEEEVEEAVQNEN